MEVIMAHGEFSLYWWDPEDYQHEELRFVDDKTAVERAHILTHGPASKLGIVKRVIITDGGDCINFEWKYGEGIVFGG
jgi:predicted metallo-beta-lactamase superfamily hydrolase